MGTLQPGLINICGVRDWGRVREQASQREGGLTQSAEWGRSLRDQGEGGYPLQEGLRGQPGLPACPPRASPPWFHGKALDLPLRPWCPLPAAAKTPLTEREQRKEGPSLRMTLTSRTPEPPGPDGLLPGTISSHSQRGACRNPPSPPEGQSWWHHDLLCCSLLCGSCHRYQRVGEPAEAPGPQSDKGSSGL